MLRIVREPIDVARVAACVRQPAFGAIATFCGVVRETSDDGRAVTGLSYEAYEGMANDVFAQIASEAVARFGECRIALEHRVGELRTGEVAVAVAVGCAHRGAAFDACEYVIDELKARAPIWKQEHFVAGASEWRENARRPAARSR